MSALSPNYRNDEPVELAPQIQLYLDEQYLPTIKNMNQANPKLLVVFSGGNGVGKSALAQKICDRFGAIMIENDDIKRWLLKLDPDYTMSEMSPITWSYTMDLYKKLPSLTRNGLVVRDGTIAWYYDRILPNFEAQGYELFIIDYDLSEQKMIQLINARGDTPTTTADRLLKILPEHLLHRMRFVAEYKPDVVLTDETVFDHDRVLDALGERIKDL